MTAVADHSAGLSVRELVIPVDLSHESWRVLPLARALAGRLNCRVSPVFVDVSSLGSQSILETSISLVADVDNSPITIEVVPGADVAATIHRLLDVRPGSALLMSTHGLGGVASRVWGTVSDELTQTIDAVVLAVGRRYAAPEDAEIRRIAVCVDPGDVDAGLIADGATWAAALDVPLVILVPTGQSQPCASPGAVRTLLHQVSERCAFAGDTVSSIRLVEGGDAAAAVVHYTERMPGTLLALSVESRPAARVLRRGDALAVVRDAAAPMLLRGCRHREAVVPVQQDLAVARQGRGADAAMS